MEKQEKSYSDWKDEGAHLTNEQWEKAGDLLLQGEYFKIKKNQNQNQKKLKFLIKLL